METNPTDETLSLLFEFYKTPQNSIWRTNMVTALNGAVSFQGKSAPISNQVDRLAFRVLRSLATAIVVGAKNVLAEGYFSPLIRPNPIDENGALLNRYPQLVVVTNGQTQLSDSRLTSESTQNFTIVTSSEGYRRIKADLKNIKVELEIICCGDKSVDLQKARSKIDEMYPGLKVAEGGPSLLTNMLRDQTIDQIALTVTPMIAPATGPFIADKETSLLDLRLYKHLVINETLLLLYNLH